MNIADAKWAASLVRVRDVTLVGDADLGYWQTRLAPEGLRPVAAGGRAQVQIIAADARFKGIRFRELSVSVQAEPLDPAEGSAGAFLVQAYTSNRFFAFVERRIFSTPYACGAVTVRDSLPAAISLAVGGPTTLHAEMFAGEPGAPPRTPSRTGDDGWEGPVYLPTPAGGAPKRKFFFARVRGFTSAYDFLPDDWFSLSADETHGAALRDCLLASHFIPKEWLIRPTASHAKSKTYARAAGGPSSPRSEV